MVNIVTLHHSKESSHACPLGPAACDEKSNTHTVKPLSPPAPPHLNPKAPEGTKFRPLKLRADTDDEAAVPSSERR